MQHARTSPDGQPDARDTDAILHDVKNLLTVLAALTARTRSALEHDRSDGANTARAVVTKIAGVVGEAIRITRCDVESGDDGDGFGDGDGLELNEHVIRHAPALASLLGGDERLHVLTMVDDVRTLVGIEEMDLLRVLVGLVRQAELSRCGDGPLELDVTACTTDAPTTTIGGSLAPGCYAHIRIGCRRHGSGRLASPTTDVARPILSEVDALSPVGALAAILTIVEETGGGLRIMDHEGHCRALEVLLPARVEARGGA